MQLFAGPEELCLVRLAEGSKHTEEGLCYFGYAPLPVLLLA